MHCAWRYVYAFVKNSSYVTLVYVSHHIITLNYRLVKTIKLSMRTQTHDKNEF